MTILNLFSPEMLMDGVVAVTIAYMLPALIGWEIE